ncbi:unnamed protein product, partial [Porites lobata]
GILSTYVVLEGPEECQNLADARQDAKTNLLCERELFTCPLTLFLSGYRCFEETLAGVSTKHSSRT